ncbi:hypothetical protein [Acetobacter conturbans]|uniref:Uncharacterized protein n=1 Tax=Acetobacter conturbans TaxID=1737472 RepID=A0ABX0JYC0_9PROT|nr:hypothetical protein [Acetobacter conturbans]NHN88005.1 hypothetical protein [Acetobacter conturbans]
MNDDEVINDDDEVIVGFLIQRESEDGELAFWAPEKKWVEDPNEAMLYEDEALADTTAETLQAENEGSEVTVAVVIEDDGEDDEDEDEV